MDLNNFCINHFKNILKKEKNRIRCKKWYEENKDTHKQNQKEYRENNKEKIKDYRENNKEKIKEYYQENKEKIKEYREENKKYIRISCWKRNCVICDDYNALYEKYLNATHCDNCNVKLTIDKRTTSTTKVLDHNHNTGLFRNILCHSCNIKRR